MRNIQTFDLYEGSFYLSKNCTIQTIEAIETDGKVSCRITIAGENIHTLQVLYFSGDATISLFYFRRTFSQLKAMVYETSRKYKNQMKAQKQKKVTGGQI